MHGATASTTGNDQNWWYQQDNETKGPISGLKLRNLVNARSLPPDALVWQEAFGDQWKPFDQTNDFAPRLPLITSHQEANYPPRWQKTFDKLDKNTSSFAYSFSFLGFLFGPFYYFYLRMWRKGLLIVGIMFSINVLFMLGYLFLDLPEFDKASGLLVQSFCALFAKRDYYRLKKFDERVWPPLQRLNNSYVIAALIVVPLSIIGISGTAKNSATGEAAASIVEKPHKVTETAVAPPAPEKASETPDPPLRLDRLSPVPEESDWVVQSKTDHFSGETKTTALLLASDQHAALLVNCNGDEVALAFSFMDEANEFANAGDISPLFKYGNSAPQKVFGVKIGGGGSSLFFQMDNAVGNINSIRDDQGIYIRLETASHVYDYDFMPRGSASALNFLSACSKTSSQPGVK